MRHLRNSNVSIPLSIKLPGIKVTKFQKQYVKNWNQELHYQRNDKKMFNKCYQVYINVEK